MNHFFVVRSWCGPAARRENSDRGGARGHQAAQQIGCGQGGRRAPGTDHRCGRQASKDRSPSNPSRRRDGFKRGCSLTQCKIGLRRSHAPHLGWERAREFHRGFCVVSPWCAAWVLRSGARDRYAWERSHSGGKTAPSASFSATVRSIRTKLRLYALIPRREPSSGLPRSTATLSPSTQPTKLRPTSATRRVRASSMCRRYSARSPARYRNRVTTEEPAADITDTNLKEGGQLGFLV
jgi:hypothetical protein